MGGGSQLWVPYPYAAGQPRPHFRPPRTSPPRFLLAPPSPTPTPTPTPCFPLLHLAPSHLPPLKSGQVVKGALVGWGIFLSPLANPHPPFLVLRLGPSSRPPPPPFSPGCSPFCPQNRPAQPPTSSAARRFSTRAPNRAVCIAPPSPSVRPYPRAPIHRHGVPVDPFSLDQRWLPETLRPGLSAVDLGWVAADDAATPWGAGPDPDGIDDLPAAGSALAIEAPGDEIRADRHRQWRAVVPVLVEEAVVRAVVRGERPADIAEGFGLTPRTVLAVYARAQKRALDLAGKVEARNAQLVEIDAVKERVLKIILAEPELKVVDGQPAALVYPRLDPKMIDSLTKLWNRRSALTGADQPAKAPVLEDITDQSEAEDAVDKVTDYMRLAEAIMKTGFGSGRVVDADSWEQRARDVGLAGDEPSPTEVPPLTIGPGDPANDGIFSPE